MTEVLAVIPARNGSKGIPDKNIRVIGGKPLLAHSIQHGLQSERITRVIVSTDSLKYAKIAEKYGAEVPFLRPPQYAQDLSPDIDVFLHALTWLQDKEGYLPEIVVHLRPTYPCRLVSDIDEMVDRLLSKPSFESVRSIVPAPCTPYKMWRLCDDGERLTPVMDCGSEELYNHPRQQLPPVYYQNACIDVVRACVILNQHSMTGKVISGYLMNHYFDIDSDEDFKKANQYMLNSDKRIDD